MDASSPRLPSSSGRRLHAPVIAAATCLALILSGCAASDSDITRTGQASDLPTLDVETFELDNGLEVILLEDHRLPIVAVNVWYHVGPANEEPGRTGFAHLFEHMMFQGSLHVAEGEADRRLQAAGASQVNGSTSFDRTNYYQTVPSDQLELVLWLESDRMGFLLEQIDQVALANQQDVVRNERRQRTDNAPYGLAREAVYHTLFPEGHPYYADIIGSHEDIQAAELGEMHDFFRRYYGPNNATISIVGDVDPTETRALVERYFGTLAAGEPVLPPDVDTPPVTSERRVVEPARVELPRIYMSWLTPPIYEPGDADAVVAANILGTGRASRLYRSLVYEQEIAQDVFVSAGSNGLTSMFQIRATARPGRTAEELEAAIDAELETLRAAPPDQSEVDRARNDLETDLVRALEDVGGLADRLNRYNHYTGDPSYLAEDLARFRAVTPQSVHEFATGYLVQEARVVIHAVPGEPDPIPAVSIPDRVATADVGPASVNPDESWRTEAPGPGEPRPLEIPVPQSFTLSNGLIVLLHERPGLPLVAASLVVRSGGAENPPTRPGLASFTAEMLERGTRTRGALDIAEDLAQLGAGAGASANMDAARITGSGLRRVFPELLEIMADMALNSTFPEEEVARLRESRLGSVAVERDNPTAVVEKSVYRALFGPEHPYGYRDLGTEDAVRAVTRDQIVAWWSTHGVPSNAALVVSGRITAEELRPLVEDAFGEWSGGPPALPSVPDPATTGARLVLVDMPGAQQSLLRVATVAVPRTTPDYESILVANAILGGTFSSRINLNLREENGFTYGAISQFVFRRFPAQFYIGSAVRTDATAAAVEEVFHEVERMRDELVTDEELSRAKEGLVRSLVAEYQSGGNVTFSTGNLFVYDLPLDEEARMGARIAAVAAEDVRDVIRRYLDPDELIVVVAGDLAEVRAPLEALGLGPVEVRDVEGDPVE